MIKEHPLREDPDSQSLSTRTRGKMSPQEAVGYGCWPDEEGRQTKHRRAAKRGRAKRKTLRTYRDGSKL